MPVSDPPDHQRPWLIHIPCRDFQQHGIIPQRLRFFEINAVLLLIGNTFSLVIFKSNHGYYNGIFIIPVNLFIMQVVVLGAGPEF